MTLSGRLLKPHLISTTEKPTKEVIDSDDFLWFKTKNGYLNEDAMDTKTWKDSIAFALCAALNSVLNQLLFTNVFFNIRIIFINGYHV